MDHFTESNATNTIPLQDEDAYEPGLSIASYYSGMALAGIVLGALLGLVLGSYIFP